MSDDVALPVFLTPRQVADMFAVNERTVLRWAENDRTMPVARRGRVIRFDRDAVVRWFTKRRSRTVHTRPATDGPVEAEADNA